MPVVNNKVSNSLGIHSDHKEAKNFLNDEQIWLFYLKFLSLIGIEINQSLRFKTRNVTVFPCRPPNDMVGVSISRSTENSK
jgi:hypothetical protein